MPQESVSFVQYAGLILTGFTCALVALLWMARRPATSVPVILKPEIAYLFEGSNLVDATEAAGRLLDLSEPGADDLSRLTGLLAPRFPNLKTTLANRVAVEESVLDSPDRTSQVVIQQTDGLTRLIIHEDLSNGAAPALGPFSFSALEDELKMHRALAGSTPFPVWRQTSDGQITWANSSYRALAGRLGLADTTPLHKLRIFAEQPVCADERGAIQRVRLELPREAEPKWFEFQTTRVGDDLLVAAVPVDRVVRAERSLNDFVQTLTQTFAHLNVGLAVFNRCRELAVFNPALTELLALQPEFLINRPSLFQVFDRLREQRMMPEPKDYKTWRRRMAALEAAAADGVYSETWSLVDGRTYRVTGRPHADGAVAFLFEDISGEITLERGFRAELQMSRAVLDGLDEAIAVFAPSGMLAMANRAYATLWYDKPTLDAEEVSFIDSTRLWADSCVPTPVWGDARDFAATIGERSDWIADVRRRDGLRLACRFDALSGGYTLVGFAEPATQVFRNAPQEPESLRA